MPTGTDFPKTAAEAARTWTGTAGTHLPWNITSINIRSLPADHAARSAAVVAGVRMTFYLWIPNCKLLTCFTQVMADQARPGQPECERSDSERPCPCPTAAAAARRSAGGNSRVDGSLTGPLVRWTISIWLVGASAAFAQCKTFSRGKWKVNGPLGHTNEVISAWLWRPFRNAIPGSQPTSPAVSLSPCFSSSLFIISLLQN